MWNYPTWIKFPVRYFWDTSHLLFPICGFSKYHWWWLNVINIFFSCEPENLITKRVGKSYEKVSGIWLFFKEYFVCPIFWIVEEFAQVLDCTEVPLKLSILSCIRTHKNVTGIYMYEFFNSKWKYLLKTLGNSIFLQVRLPIFI